MGSVAAARGKSEELGRSAEQMGEILCRKAFGEQGPDLQTSLADLEQLLGPVLERLAAGFLRASVAQQSERLGDELPPPLPPPPEQGAEYDEPGPQLWPPQRIYRTCVAP
jgi:hypothetical protein